MTRSVELIVIGAGPAGMEAAMAASAHGVETILLDEQDQAGGQYYRALPATLGKDAAARTSPDHIAGDALRSRLASSAVGLSLGRKVWAAGPGFSVDAVGPTGLERWMSRAVILACGTTERVVPFDGWTTPGVLGLAGATILLKAHQILPGRRTVVAGLGPLLPAVAATILKAGGEVAAVVDLAGPGQWMRALPGFASRPDLLVRGLSWLGTIARAGVPVLFRHAVVAVEGADNVETVVVKPVDGRLHVVSEAPERRFEADAVAIGHGLTPSTDLSRLMGAEHDFRPEIGGWVPRRDPLMRSSMPGLYVAGDCAGVAGAVPAGLRGELAGLTAARDLGKLEADRHERRAASIRQALGKAERFGLASSRLMAFPAGLVEALSPAARVCRCEDVTRAEVDEALLQGAVDLNQLKAWTRCGMGPCQGRMCGETVATLVGLKRGGRTAVGQWTARAPIRPVPVAFAQPAPARPDNRDTAHRDVQPAAQT